jgi:hypothetical protein
MKKFFMFAAMAFTMAAMPAVAETKNDRAIGEMFTKALNQLEASGMLDTLDQKTHVPITDMHIDHGLVLITVVRDTGPTVIRYEPMFNKILYDINGQEEGKTDDAK